MGTKVTQAPPSNEINDDVGAPSSCLVRHKRWQRRVSRIRHSGEPLPSRSNNPLHFSCISIKAGNHGGSTAPCSQHIAAMPATAFIRQSIWLEVCVGLMRSPQWQWERDMQWKKVSGAERCRERVAIYISLDWAGDGWGDCWCLHERGYKWPLFVCWCGLLGASHYCILKCNALTHENIKQVLIPSATTLGQHKSMQAKGSQWHDNALYSIRVISWGLRSTLLSHLFAVVEWSGMKWQKTWWNPKLLKGIRHISA